MLLRILAVLVIALMPALACARDRGQWQNSDPVIKEWYQSLMRPDVPELSCCGEADAYWCDTIHVKDGQTFCTITDDRPDAPLKRPHVEVGTVIAIPNDKLKFDQGNPVGHAVVFLSTGRYVWCFVQGTGI
jgi:hypothetical protein